MVINDHASVVIPDGARHVANGNRTPLRAGGQERIGSLEQEPHRGSANGQRSRIVLACLAGKRNDEVAVKGEPLRNTPLLRGNTTN